MSNEQEPVVTDHFPSLGPCGIRLSEDLQVLAIDFESMTKPGTALRVGIPPSQLEQLQAALAFVEKRLAEAAGSPPKSQ